MAKAVKKKSRRLKRSIRKTLGALFMASAIAVAAIPTDGLQAADDYGISTLAVNYASGTSVTIDDIFKYVPKVEDTATIYTTGDGRFQFAYVDPQTGMESRTSDGVAVILGYSVSGQVDDASLEIPDTVAAFKQYKFGATGDGYAAVNMSGQYLFYISGYKDRVDETGNTVYQEEPGPDGEKIPIQDPVYRPCYYNERTNWESEEDLYYESGTGADGAATYEISVTPRISAAMVAYIGSQYLQKQNDGTWKIIGVVEREDQGIFYQQKNIWTLKVGPNLSGIGDYAFASCTGLESITLGNGLLCLGKGAFQNCNNMYNVEIDAAAKISIIGERCFYNCAALRTFYMPIAVETICDFAFEGCSGLTEMYLKNPNALNEDGTVKNSSLSRLGNGVFKNCSNLSSIRFPGSFNGTVDVSEFEGCTSLLYIATGGGTVLPDGTIAADGSSTFDLTANDGLSFDDFKEMVDDTFYLEGPNIASLHTTATKEHIAYRFNHPSHGWVYELVVAEEADDSGTVYEAVYWVNDQDQLVDIQMDKNMPTVTMPETVGPQTIKSIGNRTFEDKCFLQTITIPASVTSIGDNAFKGCHHLKDVIFTDAENIVNIGTGAFSTQDVSSHEPDEPVSGQTQDLETELHFIGTISNTSVPFNYAMQSSKTINSSSGMYRTYITYYSGWPLNLAVRYNEYTDRNELIDYPTLDDLTEYDRANGYVYMTKELEDAVDDAVLEYTSTKNYNNLSPYQKEIIDTVLSLELPDGIESIAYVDSAGKLVSDAWVLDNATGQYVLNDIYTLSGEDGKTEIMSLFTWKEKQENPANISGSKTLTAHGIMEIRNSAFKDCDYFTAVTFEGPLKSVGDYAFEDCDNLSSVSLAESVSEMGLRPFTKCEKLSYVEFNGSENFRCDDGLIFKLGANGKTLVEYLCARSIRTVEPQELADVTEIYPEAFMATNVSTVDLRDSSITNVPVNAFRETSQLFAVWLPNTCNSISADSFTDSGINGIHIPRSVMVISNDAFRDVDHENYPNMTKLGEGGLVIYSDPDSVAYIYAQENNIMWREETDPITYKVAFYSDVDHIGEEDYFIVELDVEEGTDAQATYKREGYDLPEKDGYTFDHWSPDVSSVTFRLSTGAVYTENDNTITVRFWDWTDPEIREYDKLVREETIPAGGSVPVPKDPSKDGFIFTGWLNGIVDENKEDYFGPYDKDTDLYAQYDRIDSLDTSHIVRFYDWDETLLAYSMVEHGGDAKLPEDPYREGYTFERWVPSPTSVIEDMNVTARYRANASSGNDGASGSGGTGGDGSGSGTGGDGSGSGSGTGGDGSGSGTGGSSTFYTLTVKNGSGSGSYVAGSQPIIIADDPSSTQEFSHWTIDPDDTPIASKNIPATVITMPENNVTVTAHYQAKTGSSSGSGNSSSANSSRPNNSGGTVGGTTVVIDKNGLSNTGVVSATVNGSSDNFTIKITESSAATEAVMRALMAEYGSLDNIKYFPMDISLYDSTGTKKITDTTGLSVSITLPLPDSLITYAGNNKVAGVVNDKLDKLSAKFTTIQGVSCVTFTAEHFSPYVIYVDTANLTAGSSSDSTPKTGDGIHPKWFLSVGLACLSFVMFMQKDRRKPKKVKVKAKA